jgi:hypothetical protein
MHKFLQYLSLILTLPSLLLVTEATAHNRHSDSDRRGDILVYHEATPQPTYIDNGQPNDSVGDVRIFHFDGETDKGSAVIIDWIMTTTALNVTEDGAQARVTLGVFSFTGADVDQVLIEGVGLYPSVESTFKADSSLVRAIIGGTGRFKGVRGEVISTHLEDGSWMHEFYFEDRKDNNRRR